MVMIALMLMRIIILFMLLMIFIMIEVMMLQGNVAKQQKESMSIC